MQEPERRSSRGKEEVFSVFACYLPAKLATVLLHSLAMQMSHGLICPRWEQLSQDALHFIGIALSCLLLFAPFLFLRNLLTYLNSKKVFVEPDFQESIRLILVECCEYCYIFFKTSKNTKSYMHLISFKHARINLLKRAKVILILLLT